MTPVRRCWSMISEARRLLVNRKDATPDRPHDLANQFLVDLTRPAGHLRNKSQRASAIADGEPRLLDAGDATNLEASGLHNKSSVPNRRRTPARPNVPPKTHPIRRCRAYYLKMMKIDRTSLSLAVLVFCAPLAFGAQAPSNASEDFPSVGRILELSRQGGGEIPLSNGVTIVVSSVPHKDEAAAFNPGPALAKLVDPSDKFTVLLFTDHDFDKNLWYNPYPEWKGTLADYKIRARVVYPATEEEARLYGLTVYPTVLFFRGKELMKTVQSIIPMVNGKNVFLNEADRFLIPTLAEIGVPKTFWAERRERHAQEAAQKRWKKENREICEWAKHRAEQGLSDPLYLMAYDMHPELRADAEREALRWRGADCRSWTPDNP